MPLQFPAAGRRQFQLLGHYLIARTEADVTNSAVGGNVLILLANGLSAAVDLDRASAIGQFLRRYLPSAVREKRVQQADCHRGGGAEAGAPADGMSASVVISTPLVTPVIHMASRTSSCSRSSTRETISFLE